MLEEPGFGMASSLADVGRFAFTARELVYDAGLEVTGNFVFEGEQSLKACWSTEDEVDLDTWKMLFEWVLDFPLYLVGVRTKVGQHNS